MSPDKAGAPPSSYLLAWRLAGQKVVVVGGGAIGTAKIELLLATGARIVVIDPTPSDRVIDLTNRGEVALRKRRARAVDLIGARLLVAATGSTATNRRLRRLARVFGAVVNAVDDPENCDVTVPSIIRRGPVTVAITTDGASPAGARFLREELTDVVDRALPDRIGHVLAKAAEARRELRASGRYRYDYRAWRERFFEPAMKADGIDPLQEVTRRFVDGFDQPGPEQAGTVTLVGAGPGGADLITIRGARSLAAADVVVYDRLADPALLGMAPPAAERIPVGKSKGFGHRQEDINRLLVEHATAGSRVVRLKGGDPFVFGRGQEEVDALTAAGIPVRVIPGVSAAVSAPSLAGIPVTNRRHAASFTVLTGHRAAEPVDRSRTSDDRTTQEPGALVQSPHTAEAVEPAEAARWQALAAGGDTLVVLMAASTAADVARRLIAGGRRADEPVAFVHAAATPDQRSACTTLARVVATGCPFPAPTTMVVGPVVGNAPTHPSIVPVATVSG
ncbi:MAG: uroporphyrinogen-III C-methyltransferase [Actinomycetota bacterium]